MKPQLIKHTPADRRSFKVWENANPYNHNPWHFHPEIELTLIVEGKGTRFIGDHIQAYRGGDLVLVGENLPHEWRSEAEKGKEDYSSRSLAIHFLRDFIGQKFYQLPEVSAINSLLNRAKRGILINSHSTIAKINRELKYLLHVEGIERILGLIDILNMVDKSEENQILSSDGFVDSFTTTTQYKINDIYQFINLNFKSPIKLEDVAEQVHMTRNSLCRYFKKCTNKSLIQYLNEVRIGYACKLLIEDKMSISQAAYECGFNNLSNFNKNFKQIKGKTPSEFLKVY